MRDAMRGYLDAAGGLTELTRKRAQELAMSLLSSSGAGGGAAVAHQVSSLAEELVSAARANRSAVQEMIRGEVEIAVGRLGLVPASELAAARAQIAALESAVAELRHQSPAAPTAASGPAAVTKSRPKRAAVKQAATSRAGTKTAAKKTAAKKTAAKKTAAKKTAATNPRTTGSSL